MAEAAASKPRKRTIAASSDEDDDDVPLIKRAKVEADVHSNEENSDALFARNGRVKAESSLPPSTAPDGDSSPSKPATNGLAPPTPSDSSDSNYAPPPAKAAPAKNGVNGTGGKRARPVKAEEDSSEDDEPMAVRAVGKRKAQKKSEEDKPTAASRTKKPSSAGNAKDAKANANGKKPAGKKDDSKGKATTAKKKVKKEESEDSDSSDDEPIAKKAPVKARGAKATTSKAKPKKEASATPVKIKTKGKAKKEDDDSEPDIPLLGEPEDEEDEKNQWWLMQDALGDGTKKWTTLEHNGVLFPAPYQPLPSNVKMKYNGKPVSLAPEAEEVAGFFAVMLETDHVQKEAFRKNFFSDFLDVLKQYPPTDGTKIQKYELCDFRPMWEYFEIEKERKKGMTKDEKKALKAEKDALEENYKTCLLDGRKEKVGNFRVEPPSLFRGRGEHPKTGMLKRRVQPEQITINIGADAKVPEPPEGHQWGSVQHDNTVSWLAMWKENINGAFKYVFLGASSSLKGQSDMKKFETARKLKGHIDRIRRDYEVELSDKVMVTRQRATAMYLIDRFALRAGNEKGDDEADTVGCCSLRCEHITLELPNKVIFDFLGKDSIRFFQSFEVSDQVFKNLRIFKKEPKTGSDLLFDRLTTAALNKHLSNYMKGLSAKVFRTYNASWTLQQELEKTPADASVADKMLAYNRANRRVAILCNHQRSVSKGHAASMEKQQNKVRALKYQRMKMRHALFTLDGKNKKKHKHLTEDESDIDDEWIVEHEEDLVVKEKEKITKKFEKENAKLVEEGQKPRKDSELKELLAEVDEMAKRLKEERKTKKVEAKKSQTEDKLIEQIENMDKKIAAQKTVVTDRDEGKDISLGTSKINYLDPRITVAWCKKHEVPIEKMFSKTLREKFTWAMGVDDTYEF